MRNAILIASLLLTACATSPDDGIPSDDQSLDSHPDGKADGGESCTITSLESFTTAFGYKTIAHDDGWNSYRIGMTWNSITRLTNGDQANVTLYLLPQNRAIVEYREEHRANNQVEVINEALVVTTASFVDGKVHFAGVADGTPTQLVEGAKCTAGLELAFSSDIMSAGLAGNSTTIYQGWSSRWAIDPDHLDQIPSEQGRKWVEEDIASGKLKVIHRQ